MIRRHPIPPQRHPTENSQKTPQHHPPRASVPHMPDSDSDSDTFSPKAPKANSRLNIPPKNPR